MSYRHPGSTAELYSRHHDIRGSAKDRRRRKQWLIDTYGDGTTVECCWCPEQLTVETLEADRWPVCGHDGGRYTHDNIVPACHDCNAVRCAFCRRERVEEEAAHQRIDWNEVQVDEDGKVLA